VAIVAAGAVAGASLADTVVVNDVATGGDRFNATRGTTATAYVELQTTNGIPATDTNGCNAGGGTAALSVKLNDSATADLAFVNDTVTLAGCGVDARQSTDYTVSPTASLGRHEVSTEVSGGRTDGTRLYNTTDKLVVTVAPRPAKAPVSAVAGPGSVSLSWGASDDHNDLTNYVIARTKTGDPTGNATLGTTGGSGATSLVDSGLQPGAEYCYSVQARYLDATPTAYLSTSLSLGCATPAVLNSAPNVSSISGATADVKEGTTGTYSVAASDPDNDSLTYDWDVTSGNASISGSDSGSSVDISFTDGPSNVGLRVIVDDGNNHSVTKTLSISEINENPSTPGKPGVTSGSNPNRTGQFTLGWTASNDVAADTVTYTLKGKDADDSAYSTIATGITSNSYAFNAVAEGTWTYKVVASDKDGGTSAESDESNTVKVDKSEPNPPTGATNPATAPYNDGSTDWFKDSVTVSFTHNGDPALVDTSLGSGVASVTASQTFNTAGAFSLTGKATDNAGNESTGVTVSGKVDTGTPTASFTGCGGTVELNSTESRSWTASDETGGSDLATAASGSVTLDTGSVGAKSVSSPAPADNVGHTGVAATCSYTVVYRFNGFFQPVDNNTLNSMKGGSTAPIKWQLLDANGNYVSSLAAVTKATSGVMACNATTPVDNLEEYATGSTQLRYDSTANQYIYNWQSPKQPGKCYKVVLTFADGSSHSASFQLK
jgi:hypothetical protein